MNVGVKLKRQPRLMARAMEPDMKTTPNRVRPKIYVACLLFLSRDWTPTSRITIFLSGEAASETLSCGCDITKPGGSMPLEKLRMLTLTWSVRVH